MLLQKSLERMQRLIVRQRIGDLRRDATPESARTAQKAVARHNGFGCPEHRVEINLQRGKPPFEPPGCSRFYGGDWLVFWPFVVIWELKVLGFLHCLKRSRSGEQ